MKLTPIDPAEIGARVVFQVTCYVCMNPLFISDLEKLEDVVQTAGRMGYFDIACAYMRLAVQKSV